MSSFEAFLMGLLQGITEFIPVSSSGHISMLTLFFAEETPLFLDVFVHVATLLATLIVFRVQCLRLFKAIPTLYKHFLTCVQQKQFTLPKESDTRFLTLVLISFGVTGVLALAIKSYIAQLGQNVLFLAILFFINACILFSSKFIKSGNLSVKSLHTKSAILIGLAQCFAVLPGISRSGSCIAMLMQQKADRKLVGDYAFVLSIPTIFAAFLLSFTEDIGHINWMSASVAFLTAFVSGFFALKLLLSWIQQGKLWIFSYYSFFVSLGLFYVHFFH